MPHGHPPDPRKERYWRRLLQRWQRSGLSVRDFCTQQRCSEPSFHAWRRTLAQRDRQTIATPAPVTFVPLYVEQPPAATTTDAVLELLLTNGRRLRIPPGYPVTQLGGVLAILEGTPC